MKIQITNQKRARETTFAIAMLRTLYRWSERQYRRALLRRELRRIGEEFGEGKRQRAAGRGQRKES